ncbi:hypothetical protein RvY_16983 [Ramazzottius varieornatus]|uniref:Uncharacterized protein n=1 Tax=Ramazzottius varieornatus TaxID=947166 RepID=A0A1D1W0J2_RAMVA|nr:hypothetical protein RvY_16983 [Ramazzottius varieornatus]
MTEKERLGLKKSITRLNVRLHACIDFFSMHKVASVNLFFSPMTEEQQDILETTITKLPGIITYDSTTGHNCTKKTKAADILELLVKE